MLNPSNATMFMIKYSIYGPQQPGAGTPVPTTSPWQVCHRPLQSLWKVPGSGTIGIKFWSLFALCQQQTDHTAKHHGREDWISHSKRAVFQEEHTSLS